MTTDPAMSLLAEARNAIDDLSDQANLGIYDPLLSRITALLESGRKSEVKKMTDEQAAATDPYDCSLPKGE